MVGRRRAHAVGDGRRPTADVVIVIGDVIAVTWFVVAAAAVVDNGELFRMVKVVPTVRP